MQLAAEGSQRDTQHGIQSWGISFEPCTSTASMLIFKCCTGQQTILYLVDAHLA